MPRLACKDFRGVSTVFDRASGFSSSANRKKTNIQSQISHATRFHKRRFTNEHHFPLQMHSGASCRPPLTPEMAASWHWLLPAHAPRPRCSKALENTRRLYFLVWAFILFYGCNRNVASQCEPDISSVQKALLPVLRKHIACQVLPLLLALLPGSIA